MGLDIYVRWGKFDPEEGWTDFPKDCYDDQMTGFENAPEMGYIRHNWSSVSFCGEFSGKVGAPNPIGFCPDWDGSNGETLWVKNGELEKLCQYRDRIREWLRCERKAAVEQLFKGVTEEEKHDALCKDWEYFIRCLRNTVGLINFAELHKNEPNLAIEFA